ncbi:30S ribosomal protein S3 [Candidatus Bathyarchaeota archaeon]|jgi:small subunit ribosomal protein S3|nr:MAG: 30S ribosomal protein S3 [Candidatus Bathyarchaeota archaeon]
MSTIRNLINDNIHSLELDEFLEKELDRAGYGGVETTKTPLGTRLVIYAARPGVVIGRRGSNIRALTLLLEEKFNLPNPQIAISEIETPELNAHIMSSRIADALQRGIHFRRAGFWALNQIMRAGALGCEIVIKGKLRSRRHRYEKYKEGYIPRSGDPALKNTRVAVTSVTLNQGVLGVNVKIIPPGATFPDKLNFDSKIQPVIEPEKEASENTTEIEVDKGAET